jgi:ketosteroid isomerase-like protein
MTTRDHAHRAMLMLLGCNLGLALGTEDAMALSDDDVRALLKEWLEAIRRKNIDRLMRLYAGNAVYFDLVPPLRLVGADPIRRNFLRWFDGWTSAIGQEVRDLDVASSGDIAATFMLVRASGTLKTGREVGYWVRASVCCKRSDDRWLITHEHISLPADFASGRTVMDLVP